MVYTPASFVTPVKGTLVAVLVAVTEAPGTAAPCASVTMPVIVDKPTCAHAPDAVAANRHAANSTCLAAALKKLIPTPCCNESITKGNEEPTELQAMRAEPAATRWEFR